MNQRQKAYIGIFLILVALGLGLWQWSVRNAFLIETKVFNGEAANLNGVLSQLDQRYQNLKVEATESRGTESEQLKAVFPTSESLTELTRSFDDFEVKNNFGTNPFFINSISYQAEVNSETGPYRYLPLRLDVEASQGNLEEFIEFINSSGSLESEIRLMSIEEMSVDYPDEIGGTYRASFLIYAYFAQAV